MTYYDITYGAGYRAGFTPRKPLTHHTDGTKTIAKPVCPFTKRTQVIARALYWQGYYTGIMTSLQRWLGLNLRNGEVVL